MNNILLIILILITLCVIYVLKKCSDRYSVFHTEWLKYSKRQQEMFDLTKEERKVGLERRKLDIKETKWRLKEFKNQNLIIIKLSNEDLVSLCKKGVKK